MGREGHRQPDPTGDLCDEPTKLNNENKINGCPHMNKAIDITKIRKGFKSTTSDKCLTCSKNKSKNNEEEEFGSGPQKLWICLQCGNLMCGTEEKSHTMDHFKTPHSSSHSLFLDTLGQSLWCYGCNDELIDKINQQTKKKLKEIMDIMKKEKKTPPKSESCDNQTPSTKREDVKVNKNVYNTANPPVEDCVNVRGLLNLGNTCFFNSVLQCLAQTPYLTTVLDELLAPQQQFVLPGGKHDDEDMPPIEGILEGNCSFTSVLAQTLKEMTSTKECLTYKPVNLLNVLKKKYEQYTDGGQHDSHELLRILLEAVRTEDLKRYRSVILNKRGLRKVKVVDPVTKSQIKFYDDKANSKLLGTERIFRGNLISTLECLDCHHSSSRQEPFMDLSLPIGPEELPTHKRKMSIHEELESNYEVRHYGRKQTSSKKEKKAEKRLSKRNCDSVNGDDVSDEKKSAEKENAAGSESDADVEDNIEDEDCIPEVGESGYSSEKPSTVTSPVSAAEFISQLNEETDVIPLHDATSLNFVLQLQNERKEVDVNTLNSPSPTDVSMTDLSHIKCETVQFQNSSIMNSDLTSPEGPMSSSLTSKESLTSPVSSSVDADVFDKLDRPVSRLEMQSDREDKKSPELEPHEEHLEKEEDYVQNDLGNITDNLSKMEISCPSPSRYHISPEECSILSCLNNFTQVEVMSGSNKVTCEACTKRANKDQDEAKQKDVCTKSTKQYLVSRVPAVLILQLKRFQAQRDWFRKVMRSVSFPVLLDLSPICKGHRRRRIYALYGVVEHSGSLSAGHYVAYVKERSALKPDDPRWKFLPKRDLLSTNESTNDSNEESDNEDATDTSESPKITPPPGRWYHISDSRVNEVTEETVLKREAYLLFYERIL